MLRLEDVQLWQGDFRLRADLGVATGAVVAVMGPSGGGKSTLLAAIAGFLAPVAGRILWEGQDITNFPPAARPVSILFQDNNLFPHLTLAQNLGLGLRPALRLNSVEIPRIEEVLTQVGLSGLSGRKPGALSGGQQSRAALARVLVGGRPLVLLDEPFSALGPGLKDEMLDLAATMLAAQGRTLLMVTHDPRDALRIAGSVMLVADGVAAQPVATETIFSDPPPVLRDYLGDQPLT